MSRRTPATSAPGTSGSSLAARYSLRALMGVGEVHAGDRHVDEHLARAALRLGELDEPQHLGPSEFLLLDRAHPGPERYPRRRMSLTVVGSIAYDAVNTPSGSRDRMLGGAATHFALAASFFDEVRVIGPVGEDFDDASWEALRTRGTITDDVERVEGGKTFFWKGEYHDDLNTRETHVTRAQRVRALRAEAVAGGAARATSLFLANIQPDLQRGVREQCTAPASSRWTRWTCGSTSPATRSSRRSRASTA